MHLDLAVKSLYLSRNMKQKLQDLIYSAAQNAFKKGNLPSGDIPEVEIEEPRADAHGDFSTNIAMVMAAVQKMAPRKIAQAIIAQIQDQQNLIEKAEIAGPGFINFFVRPSAWHPVLREILDADTAYGAVNIGQGQKFQVEFVSSNPTGPLHVGHGRGAAYGAAVADLLEAVGYDVHREYYVNDAGRQMDILATSVWLRYLELGGEEFDFPSNGYKGDYVQDIAATLRREGGCCPGDARCCPS